MKKIFYSYWAIYLLLMAVNLSGLTAPLWAAQLFDVALCSTYVGLGLAPMFIFYIYGEPLGDVENKYLEGIIASFGVRSGLFLVSIYGIEDRWYVLSFFGGMMLVYYIFEIRVKLRKIEDKYFKY